MRNRSFWPKLPRICTSPKGKIYLGSILSAAETITVTKNEILYALKKPDEFILSSVEFLDADEQHVHYPLEPFQRSPDFGVTSVNYDFAELLVRARRS